MKKLSYLLALILVLACSKDDPFVTADNIKVQTRNENKVTICHQTGSQNDSQVTIQVNQSAVQAHLSHGDYLGECVDLNACQNVQACCAESIFSGGANIAVYPHYFISEIPKVFVTSLNGPSASVERIPDTNQWLCTITSASGEILCNQVLENAEGSNCFDYLYDIYFEVCPPDCDS